MSAARDLQLAHRARSHGANYSLRIVWEARRARLPISLGFALIEQESGFKNVFGHDPTIYSGAGTVTKSKYRAYKRDRGSHGQGGMQGVGPAQLTWWEFQDEADHAGGCEKPKYNIRVAFEHLATLIHRNGLHDGIAAYNGSGPAAQRYADQVLHKQARWHDRLT